MEPKLLLVEELAQNLKELKSDDENVLFTGDGMYVHGAWLKENVSKSKWHQQSAARRAQQQ